MTHRPRTPGSTDDRGFTLIELVVVVVILGVLAAVAVPSYLSYQKGARDASAEADLRAGITLLEQCRASSGNGVYPSSVDNWASGVACSQVARLSTGTCFSYAPSADGTSYAVATWNEQGTSGRNYVYGSAAAGSITTGPRPAGGQQVCWNQLPA